MVVLYSCLKLDEDAPVNGSNATQSFDLLIWSEFLKKIQDCFAAETQVIIWFTDGILSSFSTALHPGMGMVEEV